MKAMQTADAYLAALSLPGPGGFKCAEWDVHAWSASAKAKQFNQQQFQEMLDNVGRRRLFPQPLAQQGHAFPKLDLYIATALLVAKIDPSALPTVLDELVNCKQRSLLR